MSVKATTAQGKQVPVYRNIGHIIIGTDEDFNDCIELETVSLLDALEKLGFAVIPLEATA
jgi:hypothetical protein